MLVYPFHGQRSAGAALVASPLKVLLVEDVATDAELVLRELDSAGIEHIAVRVDSKTEFARRLEVFAPDIILSDYTMPTLDGMEALALARDMAPDIPFIFVSGTIGEEVAIESLKRGAVDYILKSNLKRLGPAVKRAIQDVAERRARLSAERQLKEADAALRHAQDMARLAHVVTTPDGSFESWSDSLPRLIGTDSNRLPKSTREWLDLLHPEDREIFRARTIQAGVQSKRRDIEYRLRRADGQWIQVRQMIDPIPGQSGAGGKMRWFNTLQDVTIEKEAEEKIRRLNRVHATLSGINALIVRVSNRQELFNEACRIAVEHGGFGIAWIGSYNPLTHDIAPVAWAGIDGETVAGMIRNTRAGTPQGQGMASRAIMEKKAMYSNDVASEPNIGGGGRKEAIARGYQSLIALPLLVDGNPVGNLSLFAKEANFFNADELKLLNELAGDISFALENIAKEEKITRLSRIQAVTSSINSLIVRVRDRQELFNEACRVVVEQGRFRMSWIGLHDQATHDVTPAAWAGENAEAITSVKSSALADSPRGKGAVGQAIRGKRPIFNNDITEQAFGGPRLKEILKHGFRSQLTLPLIVDQAVVATLTIYATEPDFFDEEEIRLLAELAGNISLALTHIGDEQKISRLNRVQEVTSGINSLMVRVRHRQELLTEACRIAVEHGKFGAAWIGAYDTATQKLIPLAWADSTAQFLRGTLATSPADITKEIGVVGRAIRERRPTFDNDIVTGEKGHGPRRLAAIRAGFRSLIALPFMVEGSVVGNFSLYSKEADFFNEAEVKLLAELAGNISFALEHIDRQEKLEKLSRIRTVSGQVNAAIVRIQDRNALLQETCRIAADYGKFEFVWVALVDVDRQQLQPVAWTGFSEETALAVDWGSTSLGSATLGEAIRTLRPAVRNDIGIAGPGGALRHEALERGCNSSVCLPLLVDDKIAASIILFASGRNFFDADELALLDEMAADISFALQAIARREELEYVSYYDVLTGLPNRTLFLDRLSQQTRARSSGPRVVALVLLNLERFRIVNETLGRHGGDELLRLVSQRLTDACNGKDYLARVGADVFAIVVRGATDATVVAHIVEHTILDCFKEPFVVNATQLRLAAKAGIALYPTDGDEADNLFRNAEAALKNTKVSSERYLFYAADMNARAAQALSLETRLRAAIEEQQFVLHYQPKIEFANGRICGVEALIRWQDPAEAVLVPPAKFIPILEETGMILEVGRWAIQQALADYDRWNAAGLQPPRVAVNVSQIQLRQKDFVDMVRRAVAESKARPHGLDLEITESLIMEDIENNIQKLKAIRDLGVNIAIDDFGTGYSSLGYLARLPVNALKIDRSFVISMGENTDSMTIVSTIISLAHSLDLKVIAEGVETEEQSKLLRLLNCEEMQGYLFSKPLPVEKLTQMLHKRGAT